MKQGGWKKFKELSDKVADKINKIVADKELEEDEVMAKVDQIQDKIKFAAFGKSKPQTVTAKNNQQKIEKSETEEAKELLKRQSDRMREALEKVRNTKGRVAKIFEMKDIIAGKKKAAQEVQAIRDPETGELVVSNTKIKEVTLKYCLNTLKNNEPEEDMKELIKLKEKVHALRMRTKELDREYEITEEEYFFTLWKFKTKNSATYHFITKAGHKFQLAILNLCRRFIENETFPKRFNLTTLIQLPKKGSAQELNNKRFIHMKEWLARLVEALTVQPMKEDIFEAGTKFQIGGCP